VSPRTAPRTAPRRLPAGLPWLVPALLVALTTGLLVTGGAAPQRLGDPGALVRWGLPVARGLADLGAVATIGGMLLAAAVLPPACAAWASAARIAAGAAVAWTVASVAVLVLTYADVAGRRVGVPGFGSELGFFAGSLDLGRLLLLTALLAAATATVVIGVRGPGGATWALLLAVLALVPLALTGHATGSADHETAVSGWWLHVVGVSAWLGGLGVLAAVSSGLGEALPAAARRFSAVAGCAFALVAVTGAANAWVRLDRPSDLLAGYGLLVLLKACATALLGAAGWWHRRRLLPRLDGGPSRTAFWRLVSAELVLFGATLGLAVALSSSAPPQPGAPPSRPTPAELLTGEPLPPPPTAVRWLTETNPDLLWVLAAAALAVAYVVGAHRLRARGDRWPVYRTLLWLLGCLALTYVTSGAPAAYGRTLFSVHMVQHMALSMVVPPLLVGGAPVTLALRALTRRGDGSRGPREWLLLVVESRWARLVSHPVVAAVVFAGSIVAFYYSSLLELALSTHVGHELMTVHFLLAGYLFANAVIGVDPGPARPVHAFRLLLLFATMAFHAFFGVSLLGGDTLLAADWFSATGWGIDALADQREGGAIAWGIGELPTLVLALVVAVQWSRSDEREARRSDRAADRDDDARLAEYNAMLARLGERDSRP
jgi:cytochrome c oxidase assembly factor CtaG/putative copper export protein